MIKVYQAIKNCTISYRENDNTANDFVLYPGDFFFIKKDVGWKRVQTGTYTRGEYVSCDMLTKIYHNKLISFVDENEYEWTWIDINIIDPIINGKFSITNYEEYLTDVIKDVTLVWNRDEKLNELLDFKK